MVRGRKILPDVGIVRQDDKPAVINGRVSLVNCHPSVGRLADVGLLSESNVLSKIEQALGVEGIHPGIHGHAADVLGLVTGTFINLQALGIWPEESVADKVKVKISAHIAEHPISLWSS